MTADMSARQRFLPEGPPRDASPDTFAEWAHRAEREIDNGFQYGRVALAHVARWLDGVIEHEAWRVLDYASLQDFLSAPGRGMSEKHAKNLARTYRLFVLDKGAPIEELQGVDLRTLQIAAPAVRDDRVGWRDAVSDAKALSREDMKARYAGDPSARLDATQEPQRAPCPTCGSFVPVEKLKGAP